MNWNGMCDEPNPTVPINVPLVLQIGEGCYRSRLMNMLSQTRVQKPHVAENKEVLLLLCEILSVIYKNMTGSLICWQQPICVIAANIPVLHSCSWHKRPVIVSDESHLFLCQQCAYEHPSNHLSFVCLVKKNLLEDIIFRYYNMRDYNCPPAITFPPPEALSLGMIGL